MDERETTRYERHCSTPLTNEVGQVSTNHITAVSKVVSGGVMVHFHQYIVPCIPYVSLSKDLAKTDIRILILRDAHEEDLSQPTLGLMGY